MSYDFHLKVKAALKGPDLSWVYVGDEWINYTTNSAPMIKEVCGSYPSRWNGMKAADLLPVVEQGLRALRSDPDAYRYLEPANGWGSVEGTITFLDRIRANCAAFPAAVVEIT